MADFTSLQISDGTLFPSTTSIDPKPDLGLDDSAFRAPVATVIDSVASSYLRLAFQATPVNFYRMRARVTICVSQPSYHFWTAEGAPDTTGFQVPPGTAPCGANPLTDFVDFTVVEAWAE